MLRLALAELPPLLLVECCFCWPGERASAAGLGRMASAAASSGGAAAVAPCGMLLLLAMGEGLCCWPGERASAAA